MRIGNAKQTYCLSVNSSIARTVCHKNRLAAAILALVFPLLVWFVARHVQQEHFIYYWDYSQYHDYYRELGSRFVVSPFRALVYVIQSVRDRDYNLLPALFLMPFRLSFGPGRLSYILSLTFTYALPSVALFPLVVNKFRGTAGARSEFDFAGLTLISILSLALLPQLWSPLLLGYVDIGGLLIIFAVFYLYFRTDFLKQSYGSLASIALFLSFLILFRRWYAYWVVGFFAAVAASEGLRLLQDAERRAKWMLLARNAAFLGGVSVLFTYLVATPIARRMLQTDYRDIYSAYRSSHVFAENCKALVGHFGLLTLALAAIGILFSLMDGNRRWLVYFLGVQFAVAFALFTRTQNFVVHAGTDEFGGQHFYWALPTIALFLACCGQGAFLRAKSAGGMSAVLALFSVLNYG